MAIISPKYKLSVRLMTYMHESFVNQAMDGIMMQKTDFKIEVVVGDDFSTDRTLEIIKSYKNTESIDVKILKREKGDEYWRKRQKLGRLYNFTNILENCTGKYIALLDGDDYWTDPLKLQKQLDFLEGNEGYSMCFHRVQLLINEKLEKDTITRKVPQTTSTSDLLKGNFIHTPSVVFRNHFDEENLAFFLKSIQFSPIGDLPLHVYNSQYGKIYQIPESMAVYRLGSGIWSVKKKSERIQSTIRAYICLAAFLKTQSDFDYLYKNIEIYFHQLHKLRQPIKPNEASFKDLSKALMRKVKKKFLS